VLAPGDVGRVTALHGELYAREYGWDLDFEAYVAEGIARFVLDHDPARDRFWIAERAGELVGSIAISGQAAPDAQLRWFVVHPGARRGGLGRRLLDEALDFCRARPFRSVFLWTVADLTAAARLYRAAGFRVAEEHTHRRWGRTVTEQRYELSLAPERGSTARAARDPLCAAGAGHPPPDSVPSR